MPGEAQRTDDPVVGTTVADRFEVKDRIARGGMGYIYHAVQIGLGRDVALKVMHAEEDADAAAEFAKRMLNEAAAASRLSHPNTIVIHDYGHLDDGRCFIAMELLDGITLHDLVKRTGPLDADETVHIALQITGSLAEAHRADMIHRDLKPGNVMLTKKGADPHFVKVVDFGLVKNDPKDAAVDESGALVGTPRYMAPEQVVNEKVSPATDIYGLGATLYHVLTGRPPFESDSRFVLMAAHVTTAPKAMSEVLAEVDREVPPELEAVVMRCLQKEPKERYQSMGELAEALAATRTGAAPTTMRASLPPESQARRKAERQRYAATSEIDALAETVAEKPYDPQPWLWGALGLVALLAAGAAVAFAGGMFDETPAPEHANEVWPEPDVPTVPDVPPVPVPPVPAPPASIHGDAPAPPAPAERPVTVQVEPANATLHHGEDDLGNGPLTVEIPPGERWTIDVRAPGYQERSITLTGAQREVRVVLERRARRRPASETTAPASTGPPQRSDNRDPWAEDGAD